MRLRISTPANARIVAALGFTIRREQKAVWPGVNTSDSGREARSNYQSMREVLNGYHR